MAEHDDAAWCGTDTRWLLLTADGRPMLIVQPAREADYVQGEAVLAGHGFGQLTRLAWKLGRWPDVPSAQIYVGRFGVLGPAAGKHRVSLSVGGVRLGRRWLHLPTSWQAASEHAAARVVLARPGIAFPPGYSWIQAVRPKPTMPVVGGLVEVLYRQDDPAYQTGEVIGRG